MVDQRDGDWIQTFTERQFWPLDPKPEDVCIEDIAHALSLTCRYGGHCKRFYSVAEHSIHVAAGVWAAGGDYLERLRALLHDAGEAYLCDVPRPVKPCLPGFAAVEARIEAVIAETFNIGTLVKSPLIKEIDTRILVDEVGVLMGKRVNWHRKFGPPVGVAIPAWAPEDAEGTFLREFHWLMGRVFGLS
ncbi:hypothetical protein LCGC14_0964920 [marine sediment metagenome]|uniref:HD/PDEase domain-containing protein n=1 Tax=marine sediment metagenome TaxID=412755 RepID=A0A0F9NHV7_9ZZZZ